MNVTLVTTAESNPVRSLPGRWQITSPMAAPPLRFFRRAACLCFETGGVADRISIDLGSTTLRAVFGPYDYDALNQNKTSLKASLTASEGAVSVALEAPRQVRRVSLSSGTAPGSGYSVELYRLDGNTLADKPTISVGVQNNVATLPSDADFTDARFAIRLVGPDGTSSLSIGNLTELRVRGYPTGPRLGIADPKDAGSAVFFWQVAGEVGKAVPADRGNVEAGEAFTHALEGYLDDFFVRLAEPTDENGSPPPTPEAVEVALVAASDAPCVLDVTAFSVTYYLVLQSLFSGEGTKVEKQVLQLTGDQTTVQEVTVQLPANADVKSVSLETVESFRDDRLLASDNGGGLPEALLERMEGVYVGVERWAAQGLTPPRAVSISGIAVALMATMENTEVLVELREDWRGQPSGSELAAGTIVLEQAGRRGWLTLLFPEPIVLSLKPHWILMRAASGRAVWLADAGDTPARVFERPNNSAVWVEASVLSGLQTMYAFLSRSKQAQEEQQAVSLAIGERVVAAAGKQNDTRSYDLTSAVDDYLDSLLPGITTVAIPFTFTATSQGFITVYPPTIEFDLE